MTKRLGAEFLGTFWLVLGGCGAAVLATGNLDVGIGWVGVSLAFGLTVLTGAYAFGPVSGGHFNPAVTLGLVVGRRCDAKYAAPYIVTQVVAALAAAALLWIIALDNPASTSESLAASGFASNGYDQWSPEGYGLVAALVVEVVMTAAFLFVILGVTAKRAASSFAGVAIGLCLTLVHLVSVPVTNASVNPARSTGPAIMAAIGGEAGPLGQLWLFWLAPLVGALIAGLAYGVLLGDDEVAADD